MINPSGISSVDNLRQLARNSSLPDNASSTMTATAKVRQQLTKEATVNQQQAELQQASTQSASLNNDNNTVKTADTASDSVRVSSTIGKAASSGMLTRDEAVAIYQKIAGML
jgi:hypothetical protein